MPEVIQEPDVLASTDLLELPDSFVRGEHFVRSNPEKFVAFYLGSELFALPAETVAEVVHPYKVTTLPGAPPVVLGITPVRGEVAAVLDVRSAVCVSEPASPKGKLIVLNSTGRYTQLAFPVDRMHEIIQIDPNEIEPPAESIPELFIGRARTSGGIISIFDADRLPVLLK